MLEGFGGDQRGAKSKPVKELPYGIACYHVNARVSKALEDIGSIQFTKFFHLLWHCIQAIWCHFRYGVDTMYYIPAPGKRAAITRDWMVMLLCRPFYKKIILHWHAAGLAKWLETEVQMATRSYTYKRMKNADLSIVLSRYNRADAAKLLPKRIMVVSNGIPDPCPQFDTRILPRRRARYLARLKLAAKEDQANPDTATLDSDLRSPRPTTQEREENSQKAPRIDPLNLPGNGERHFPGSATVPVAVSGVSPDTLPSKVSGEEKKSPAVAVSKLSQHELTPADMAETGGNPEVFKVLFLAHCTADKGLFDSVNGVILANRKLAAQNSRLGIALDVAGGFFNGEEKAQFEAIASSPEGKKCIRYMGFVSGEKKEELLREADCFCFPTYFRNENQPVNLIEAMAFGLPILTSRWRSIPELFPVDFRSMVDIRSPEQVADTLIAMTTGETAEAFREIFLKSFNLRQHLTALAEAFRTVETDGADNASAIVQTRQTAGGA